MCLYLILHVKRCQDKNMTFHRNPSPNDQNADKVEWEGYLELYRK
jgi:hypothetical protein